MKYIMLRSPEGALMPLCCLAPVTHADLAAPYLAKGYTVVSAGFLRFLPEERFDCIGWSHSLNVGPHGDDARRFSALYSFTLKSALIP
jgi:hypothetical protein